MNKLLKDEKWLELATIYYQETAITRLLIDILSNKEDLENKAN
jgi:hypothetical protein